MSACLLALLVAPCAGWAITLPRRAGLSSPRAASVVMALGGSSVPEVPFAAAYKPQDIESLWKTLQKVYGGEEAARQAVRQNAQVICPLYGSPSLMTQSYDALVEVLGKEEAAEVLQKNPMVLTCGRGLLDVEADEIRSAANTRQFLDKWVTPQGLSVAIAVAELAIAVRLAGAS